MKQKKNIIAIPPGASITEVMQYLNISRSRLAEHLGLNEAETILLLAGKLPVTNEYANKLESLLGPPASFWLGLEKNYKEKLALIHQLSSDIDN